MPLALVSCLDAGNDRTVDNKTTSALTSAASCKRTTRTSRKLA
eukprot:CAMPEP_0173092194 /NCGR_PEP_ID=MMETSP1102-20130122/28706_1 /TAXON_ID=49646 /ORGANISM="Geminigera sp., Strain Caron Lab Isolate" /LENGTH=42 /DNA_ID= /DNA_START= /DNA_END= /DNA_ORIENTATION=